jgi:hypothetical protein
VVLSFSGFDDFIMVSLILTFENLPPFHQSIFQHVGQLFLLLGIIWPFPFTRITKASTD